MLLIGKSPWGYVVVVVWFTFGGNKHVAKLCGSHMDCGEIMWIGLLYQVDTKQDHIRFMIT
jgi:hypothetical protein